MATQCKYASKLKGVSVLIIGGSSGIGFGVAEALIEHDASFVAISSSNPSRVDNALQRLRDSYPNAKTQLQGLVCNLGDQATLESNIKHLFASLNLGDSNNSKKKLDHIVFTAGDALPIAPLSSIDVPFAIKAGLVRFFAPMMVGKHAPSYLNPGPDSSIILTGAISEKPREGFEAISGYIIGLHGLTRNLALDLRPTRVNLICPGLVDTELWKEMPAEAKKAFFETVKQKHSTGRVGRVEDVVESYLYVMRDGNISGTAINTNGGYLVMP